ncbi:MAG TPA: hypothetical protein VG345_05530 [Bryobacteraceae bacterium]|nr:hypothetical protein [Bryobacteraceae bacterium]
MEQTTPSGFTERFPNLETYSSGVSWAAVIAGAFVTAALSLVLLALGAGFGLSSVSPWANAGASASTVGNAAIVWLIVIQILASAMGGYLAGRLRTKWTRIHTDEVYFRDTAHGFLAWAVALVITAAFLATAAASMAGTGSAGVRGSSSSMEPGAPASAQSGPEAYFIDALFRSDRPPSDTDIAAMRTEVGPIFANALRQRDLPAADKAYLVQLVMGKTNLGQPDADKRVSEVFTDARQALDTTRKAAARLLLWLFLALLIGAFCASYAGTIGGRQRDHVKTI